MAVAQHSCAGFTTGFFLDEMRQFVNITHMFGNRHDRVFFTFRDTRFDFVYQVFTAEFNFRNHNEFTATGNGRSQRQIATITAHHFHHGNTLVRRRGVTQTVDRFYNGAQRSEETDSVVSAFDVVVDSARQIPNRRDAIKEALRLARKGDVILLIGKGHEMYEEIEGTKYPFDEREVVCNALNELRQQGDL